MYLRNAADLSTYLAGSDPSGAEIAKHLVLKTFAELSPTALYVAELSDDGYLVPVAAFGFDKVVLASWGKFPLAMEIPITDAVRNDKCIMIDSAEQLLSRYPIIGEMEDVSYDWASVVALPMNPFGVAFVVLSSTPSWDEDLELYLRLVGAVVALHLTRQKNSKEVPEYSRKKLTDRTVWI